MNVLAIGAHCDDVELGCGGSLAKHVDLGDEVLIYTATTSGGMNPLGKMIRDSEKAQEEAKKAADIIGAKLIFGRFETNNLDFCDELNAELIRIIEKNSIEMIYTHSDGDAHHDHIYLSKASIHSGRHVNRILTYQSNWYSSQTIFVGNFYQDITDYWEKKEMMLNCYEDEMERTKNKWIELKKCEAVLNGFKCGVKYAECFNCIKWVE